MKVRLAKRFRFDAAHFLPHVPEGHRCRRLHGHSFEIEVEIEGPMDPERGWVMDYGDLAAAVRPHVEAVDHQLLNAVPGLENPTSEVIVHWFWERLVARIPALHRVTVFETCTTRCDLYGPSVEGGAAEDEGPQRRS
jgi:6-pyruvoyltetrahydropterin/6-carboxytetrahydropterin synthase